MSVEIARYGIARHVVDGDWSVRAVVEIDPKRYTIVIDEAGTVVRVQLTAHRARALIQQLTYMLEDTDEPVSDSTTP